MLLLARHHHPLENETMSCLVQHMHRVKLLHCFLAFHIRASR
jgi:hypothetical protein